MSKIVSYLSRSLRHREGDMTDDARRAGEAATSDKFRIYKQDDGYHLPWNVDYPTGFDEFESGAACETFADAIAAFIEAADRRCIICDRGAVEDRPWGWQCTELRFLRRSRGHRVHMRDDRGITVKLRAARRERTTAVSFEAKYHGRCLVCNEQIKPGDQIEIDDSIGRAVHAHCDHLADVDAPRRNERRCPDCHLTHAGACL